MTEWLLLGVGVLLTLGTGLFVAAEFSLLTVDRSDVERQARSGDPKARGILTALTTLSTQLSGSQVGITLTTLLVGFLVEPSLSTLLQGPLEAVGLPPNRVSSVAVACGMGLATVGSMLLGELIPKNLAISAPEATARVAVPFQRGFTWCTRPLIRVLNGSANVLLHRIGVEPQEELSSGRSPEELTFMVRRSAEAGTLDEGTATLVARTLAFSRHTAADVMTHRTRTQSLGRDEPAAEVLKAARRTGHSRFPVTGESLDDVVGVVHVKSAVGVPLERRDDVPVGALMSPVLRVPETMALDPLLVELRDHGMQLAVVEDEYGGTAGVVTLEDVVEELVGEVSDEHDRGRQEAVRGRDGTWRLPGSLRPDEIKERIGVEIPEHSSYETVAGFVMADLGRLAMSGDEVAVPGALLRVERMAGRRIERIRLLPQPETADPAVRAG